MSNKNNKQWIKFTRDGVTIRNPLVRPTMFRKAGAHEKSFKAKRTLIKQRLRAGIYD